MLPVSGHRAVFCSLHQISLSSSWTYKWTMRGAKKEGIMHMLDNFLTNRSATIGAGVSNKHAFIGLGFRERPQAYDFQAALFDHVKYMNKKKEAEEIEQEYQSKPSTDYSIKEGETLRLQLKTQKKSSGNTAKPNITDKRLDVSTLREALPNPDNQEECPKHVGPNLFPFLAPPPSPKAAPKASPSSPLRIPSISASRSEDHLLTAGTNAAPVNVAAEPKDCDDEDFGDFQGA
jgi:hypothetical protein